MNSMKIKPTNKNTPVRDPETRRPLADEGEVKPKNPYWMRRLNDGDVEIVDVDSKKTSNRGGNNT